MKQKFVAAYLVALISAQAQTYEQKIARAMEKVDRVTAQGPFHANWKSLAGFEVPQWYLQEVRNLHSLGRLFGSGVRQ